MINILEGSMSRVGRCIDNGPMETSGAFIKCDMYYLNYFKTYEGMRSAVGQFIYYYTHQRRQHKAELSATGYLQQVTGGYPKENQDLISKRFYVNSWGRGKTRKVMDRVGA